jgi:hypothetical protein
MNDPEMLAHRLFMDLYNKPFYNAHRDDSPVGEMLDLIADAAFSFDGTKVVLHPVVREKVVTTFMEPIKEEEAGPTAAEADQALAFLVDHGMILIDGDQITIPERFLPDLTAQDGR